jgi:O-antigen/teichoic acid export membrane protein
MCSANSLKICYSAGLSSANDELAESSLLMQFRRQATKMPGLIRRVGLYGIATVLPSAVTFFFLPILTRQMPRSDYGTMSALTALYNLFFLAFTLYLDRSLSRLYFLYEGESRRELIGTLLIAVLTVATFGLLATFALSSAFEKIYPAISARRFSGYGFALYFTVIIYFARTYYTTAEKPAQYLWLSLSVSAATVIAMYWFAVLQREGIDGWIKALIVSNAVVAIPATILVARSCTLRFRWKLLREALVYAGPMIPSFFCNWLSNSVDRLFVGRWSGMGTNALYGAASQLGNILQIAFLPIFMAWTPIFYRLSAGGAEERALALACNRFLVLLIGTASCVLIAVAPALAGTVLPTSYLGVSGTFAWLVVAGSFAQAAGIGTAGLYHCRRTDLVLYTSILQAAVSVIADVALIPSMGREGAVIGQLLSNAAIAAGTLVLAQRTYGKIIENGFYYRNLLAVVIMGFLAAVLARGGYGPICVALELVVFAFFGMQLWAEKGTVLALMSRNLWQGPAESQPVG